MEKLTFDNIEDGIYKVVCSEGKHKYIARLQKGDRNSLEDLYFGYDSYKPYFKKYKDFSPFNSDSIISIPSTDEIKWFEKCKELNKFIPFESINLELNYSLF